MRSRRDEFDQSWQPRLWIRIGLLILIGAYLIAFIVGNDEDASVNFVLWEARTSLIWVILLSLLAGLVGAITWNLITWYFGLPSSSTHALIGGLVGAALAASSDVQWLGVFDKVVIPMIVSPLVGFGLAYLFMLAIL